MCALWIFSRDLRDSVPAQELGVGGPDHIGISTPPPNMSVLFINSQLEGLAISPMVSRFSVLGTPPPPLPPYCR